VFGVEEIEERGLEKAEIDGAVNGGDRNADTEQEKGGDVIEYAYTIANNMQPEANNVIKDEETTTEPKALKLAGGENENTAEAKAPSETAVEAEAKDIAKTSTNADAVGADYASADILRNIDSADVSAANTGVVIDPSNISAGVSAGGSAGATDAGANATSIESTETDIKHPIVADNCAVVDDDNNEPLLHNNVEAEISYHVASNGEGKHTYTENFDWVHNNEQMHKENNGETQMAFDVNVANGGLNNYNGGSNTVYRKNEDTSADGAKIGDIVNTTYSRMDGGKSQGDDILFTKTETEIAHPPIPFTVDS